MALIVAYRVQRIWFGACCKAVAHHSNLHVLGRRTAEPTYSSLGPEFVDLSRDPIIIQGIFQN